jgi:hypothetical protein
MGATGNPAHVMKRELQHLPHFAAVTDTINQKFKKRVETKHGARSASSRQRRRGGEGGVGGGVGREVLIELRL